METWFYFVMGGALVLILFLLGFIIYLCVMTKAQAEANQMSLSSICTYINNKEAEENEVHEPCIGFRVDDPEVDEDDDDEEDE